MEKKGKSYWYNTAKNLIENYFNNINNFKCYSEKEDCCMCKDGISARFTIEKAAYEKIADYKIIVYKRTKIKRTYKDNNNVYFNYEDINTVTNYDTNGKSYEQITIIHEFGHMLGLSHPGKDPNSISDQGKSIEYDADSESLMGRGNVFRIADYQKAFCDKLSKSKIIGSDCSPWKAKETSHQ